MLDLAALVRLLCVHPIRTLEAPLYTAPLGIWAW